MANKYLTLDGLSRLWSGLKAKLTNVKEESDISNTISDSNPTITDSINAPFIYNKISGYTSQDGTPTPDASIRIEGLGDKGYFDGYLLQGYISGETGEYVLYCTYRVCSTHTIPCNENDIITFKYEEVIGRMRLFFYDEDNSYLGYETLDDTDTITVTAPANAVKFHFDVGYTTNELSITPGTAKHIVIMINDKYTVQERIVCKNIFDIDRTIIDNNASATHSISDDGVITITTIDDVYSGIFMHLDKDWTLKPIVVSAYVKTDTDGKQLRMGFSGNIYTYELSTSEWTRCVLPSVLNTGNTLVFYGNSVAANVYIKDIQIEYGDEVTDYEEHKNIPTYIPIDSPLYEGDYIEEYADGTGKLVRTMKSVTFDGTEGWYNNDSAASNTIGIPLSNVKKMSSDSDVANMTCSHFITSSRTSHINHSCSISTYSNFCITDDTICQSGSTLLAWLAENPITVLYQLETPVETELTAEQLAEFKKLYTFESVTNILCDGEVTVQYQKTTNNGKTTNILQNTKVNTDGSNVVSGSTFDVNITGSANECEISNMVSGTNPTTTDSIEAPFIYNKINGFTTQDGTPTPDSPIDIEGLGDSGTIDVKICGKNLLHANAGTTYTKNGLTVTVNDDGSITVDGTSTAQTDIYPFHSSWAQTNVIIPYTGRRFIISRTNSEFQLLVGDSNGVISGATWSDAICSKDITFAYLSAPANKTFSNHMFYPMIRYEDIEDDTYELYQETKVSIPIDAPLYSGDYIEEYADGSGKLVRTMGSVNLTTVTGWQTGNDIALIQFSVPNVSQTYRSFAKCNQLSQKLAYDFTFEHFYLEGNAANVFISKSRFSNSLSSVQSEFTAYIADSPMKIVYPLETSEEIELTAEQMSEFKKLYTFDSITNVFCDGEMSIRYQKETNNSKVYKVLDDKKVDTGDLSSFDFSTLSEEQITQLKSMLGLS